MSQKRQNVKMYPKGDRHSQVTSLSWDFAKGEDVESHFHEEDQLVYSSSGVMLVRASVAMWVVPPLKAVWIPGKVIHSIKMPGSVSLRTIYFAKGYVKSLPRRCFVMNVAPLLRELILSACATSRLSLKLPRERRMIEMIVDQLNIRDMVPLQLPLPKDARALRVAEALINDPSTGALLGDLTADVGGSKRTIERLFVDETGMSLGKWRQQLRMLHSVSLLAAGEKVINVALEAGYNSPSAFVSAFRKVMGTTPSNYCSPR